MKIQQVNNHFMKSINNNYQCSTDSCKPFRGNEIKKENGYVMIPEKKYKRDRLIECGIVAVLILIEIIREFSNRSKYPKL